MESNGHLASAIETLKEAALREPDPVLAEDQKPFAASDIKDAISLARKIQNGKNAPYKFIWQRLSQKTRELIAKVSPGDFRAQTYSDDCVNQLETELGELIAGRCFYDEALFADIKLSTETRRLLEKNPGSGRELIRLNQALLEDLFPDEIRCETAERAFLERLAGELDNIGCGLSNKNKRSSDEAVACLAVALLTELACIEQLGRIAFTAIDPGAFDSDHWRLRPNSDNNVGKLNLRNLTEGDCASVLREVRNFTGLAKCLLYWFAYACHYSAKPFTSLNPDQLEKSAPRTMTGAINYKELWAQYRNAYQQAKEDLADPPPENAADATLAESLRQIEELIHHSIEQRVVKMVAGKYDWEEREAS